MADCGLMILRRALFGLIILMIALAMTHTTHPIPATTTMGCWAMVSCIWETMLMDSVVLWLSKKCRTWNSCPTFREISFVCRVHCICNKLMADMEVKIPLMMHAIYRMVTLWNYVGTRKKSKFPFICWVQSVWQLLFRHIWLLPTWKRKFDFSIAFFLNFSRSDLKVKRWKTDSDWLTMG